MVRIILVIVYGCFHSTSIAQVTYHNHIKPILEKNCTSCHSKGNIGPMVLDTYDDVASYAQMINFVTRNQFMPPFKADYSKVAYANKRSLTDTELDLIEEWIQSGLMEGSSPGLEQYQHQPKKEKYDTLICMSEAFEHYGIYYDQYQAFVLPIDFQEDKKVNQINFLPGNKEIVRSAYISIAEKGNAQKMDDWDPRYGYYSYGGLGFEAKQSQWHSWMPNTPSTKLRPNEFLYLPKESEFILQLHYGPFGEVQKDSSCIALSFEEDSSISSQLQNVPIISTQFLKDQFLLPKGEKIRYSSSFYIPTETKLKSITPLAHLLCKQWEIFAVLPDKSTISLLSIDDWDFHWREKYIFNEYITLPKNTRIVCTAIYDNSLDNPYNPSDPPVDMKQGPHMYDENYLCYFEFIKLRKPNHALLDKPYTLGTSENRISFSNFSSGQIKILAYNLSNQNEWVITEGFYPKGKHQLLSSEFPTAKGQYAIVLIKDKDVEDFWYFVKH